MTRGLAVKDGFISLREVRALVRCAALRRARGDFAAARVGTARRLGKIRGDLTCWLDRPLYHAEAELLERLEQLRLDINREGFLGAFDLEAHYACYPPGAGYVRHVDQLRQAQPRLVSLVLYLNEAWTPDAGGELRIFGEDACDIEPIAGRLVLFLTAGREHAVLQSRRERLSVTGWFRGRDPGLAQ